MNADELKALQAPLKDQYRSDPDSAVAVLSACGDLDIEQVAVNVRREDGASCTPGMHPMAGGDGTFACAAEMMLEALIGCAGVTFAAVCTAMSIPIDAAEVEARGTLDFRGTLGVDRSTPVGFTNVEVEFRIRSEAPDTTLAKAVELAERYCVVAQTLKAVHSGWKRL